MLRIWQFLFLMVIDVIKISYQRNSYYMGNSYDFHDWIQAMTENLFSRDVLSNTVADNYGWLLKCG